jgi:hypothetical protein
MSESPGFEWLSAELEQRTALSRLEARGTVRLVLKEAGLETSSVTPAQLGVVMTRLLPTALVRRGVTEASALCDKLGIDLRVFARTVPATTDATYALFERLGNDPREDKK